MATGAGASSSQLRDDARPASDSAVPDAMGVQHMRVSNKATALRELHRSQRMHMEKLRNMKPGIDMKRPGQPKFSSVQSPRSACRWRRSATAT